MLKQQEGLDFLIKRISIRINKSPGEIEPFFKILHQNWYDSEEALRKLTFSDYERMKIPHRIAQAITEELNSNTSVSQSNQQNQNTKNGLNEQTMLNLSKDLKAKVLQNVYNNKVEARSILEILYKLISNIVKDPYEMKFRSLKKSNNLIQKNIMQQPACLEYMKAIGFQDCGETLQLSKFDVPQLIFFEDCLNHMIMQLGGNSMVQQQQRPPQKEQNMFLNVTKFPTNQNEVKEQFSQQKLAQTKYFDALEKLVQIRNRMMSQHPQDRRIRIYHKKFEAKNVQIAQMSFQQQFEKSNDKIIAGYWKQIVANNMKSQKFQSKRKLQFEYLIKQKIHKETLIKVKLPNELIIQAYFAPLEKLSEVFKVVADIVIGDLYLFTAPPKKIMEKKQMDKTLIDLDAVPMGSFYLGTKDAYYIQQKYVPYIQQ